MHAHRLTRSGAPASNHCAPAALHICPGWPQCAPPPPGMPSTEQLAATPPNQIRFVLLAAAGRRWPRRPAACTSLPTTAKQAARCTQSTAHLCAAGCGALHRVVGRIVKGNHVAQHVHRLVEGAVLVVPAGGGWEATGGASLDRGRAWGWGQVWTIDGHGGAWARFCKGDKYKGTGGR